MSHCPCRSHRPHRIPDSTLTLKIPILNKRARTSLKRGTPRDDPVGLVEVYFRSQDSFTSCYKGLVQEHKRLYTEYDYDGLKP